MKGLRASFEENYKPIVEPCKNKRGFRVRYEYIGPWYSWDMEQVELKKEKRVIGGACAVSLAFFWMAAWQSSVLNYSRYVELFGLLSVAAYIFEIIGTVQFCVSGTQITALSFSEIDTKLKIAPLIHGGMLICASLAGLLVLVRVGMSAADVGILACYLGAGLASMVLFWRYIRLKYRKEDGGKAQALF